MSAHTSERALIFYPMRCPFDYADPAGTSLASPGEPGMLSGMCHAPQREGQRWRAVIMPPAGVEAQRVETFGATREQAAGSAVREALKRGWARPAAEPAQACGLEDPEP